MPDAHEGLPIKLFRYASIPLWTHATRLPPRLMRLGHFPRSFEPVDESPPQAALLLICWFCRESLDAKWGEA